MGTGTWLKAKVKTLMSAVCKKHYASSCQKAFLRRELLRDGHGSWWTLPAADSWVRANDRCETFSTAAHAATLSCLLMPHKRFSLQLDLTRLYVPLFFITITRSIWILCQLIQNFRTLFIPGLQHKIIFNPLLYCALLLL